MRAAGLQVDMAEARMAQAAWELNIGFFSRVLRGRPWLRLKVAASLDGRTALDNGQSQWITGAAARTDGHAWRKRASAVLTGIGTVLADDPRLDVRLVPSAWQPLRVVVDSTLRTPPTARLLQPPGQVLLVTALPSTISKPRPSNGNHVETINVRSTGSAQVDLHQLLQALASRGVNELHVEAGALLNGALAAAGLVDEWLLYIGPKLLGAGRGMVALPPITDLNQALSLRVVESCQIGDDLRIRLRPATNPFSYSG